MKNLLPTPAEAQQINSQRAAAAAAMSGNKLIGMPGPCSPDLNRMPGGELAAVYHNRRLAAAGKAAGSTLLVVRYVAEKPRTTTGQTGIIHQPGGAQAYVKGARQLHAAGIPFASEVMSDTGAAIVVPHLTMGWVGAREVSATGPRYAVRPTNRDRDNGTHPLPVWVKSGQNGSLKHTVNAVHTIMSETPEPRTRIGSDGLEEVVTYGNPHVGVILRGHDARPPGDLEEVIAEEIGTAREILDSEFGKGAVPVAIDLSHAHAKYEGGGEAGQLAMAGAVGSLMVVSSVDAWMAETYIHPGKQPEDGGVPGLSITDACIGQAPAEQLVLDMDYAWAAAQGDVLDIGEVVRV